MSKATLYKHYLRAFSRLPPDALRPELQLRDALRRRVDKTFEIPPAADSPAPLDAKAYVVAPKLVAYDEKYETEQVNALYSLLENRYSNTYPLEGRLLTPKTRPTYYKELITELEEAPNRSWFARMANKWKGFLRFQ